jgi:hypothetical protein
MACRGGRPVPNDEYCRVVLVNAAVMVNTVVAGGVEQPLHNCRQLADRFGMNPKLVDGIQLMHSCIPAQGVTRFFNAGLGRNTQCRGENEREREVGQPGKAALEGALPQRSGEVVVLAGVVHVVCGPQQVALVTGAMEAVVA